MHWLDRIAAKGLRRLPPRDRVFREGWGDRDRIDAYLDRVATIPPISDPPIAEERGRTRDGVEGRRFRFESPAEDLPEASRTARAQALLPGGDPRRVVILMAQWNDHDPRGRHRLARLLLDRDIAVVIPENPYYGDRRPNPGDGQPIVTVADFGAMGRAAVLEGRVLAHHFHRRGSCVGISGFSMGGNLAAFVAATVPFAVAAAPLAGSHSPAPVFLDGILRHSIAWDALGGENDRIREALRDYLGAASVLDHPAADHLRAAVLVAGTKDGFVPTSAVHALHRHWPGSTLDWVNAGHGSLLWRRKDRLLAGITSSFDRLEGLGEG